MATEAGLKAAIQNFVSQNYSMWTIGVTDDLNSRKAAHRNPPLWHQWDADTEQVARNVEKYFLAKGMKGGPGGPGRADYVYIF